MAEVAERSDEREQLLPSLKDGDEAVLVSVRVVEKKTRPPTAYTEGTLIEDMKNAGKFLDETELKKILRQVSGLGTSATRDNIIEALKHHGYLARQGKHIVATQKGVDFILWLETACPELVDVASTARWEARLDVIAHRGGGKEFERDIASQVTAIVATLKSHHPMNRASGAPSNKESSPMQEPNATRTNKPTDKMVSFAESIAKRLEIPVPDEARESFDACKAFIDTNKDAPGKDGSTGLAPTEKQLSFANNIAAKRGLTIPGEVRANRRELSAWIDANKG